MTYQQRNNEIWRDGMCIARCLVYGSVYGDGPNSPGEENAAEMTAKLNAYTALLAACEEVARVLEAAPEHIYDYVGMNRVHKAVYAAIAQAEADQ